MGLEPDLADGQARGADDQGGREIGQVALDVGVLLIVIRRVGKNYPGLVCADVAR